MAAIILAAGRSTRMGEAKQLLPLGNTTLLGQTINNVCRSQVKEIVLVLGASADCIRQQLPAALLERVQTVVNPDYGQGMAASLRTGLTALDPQTDAALIVLADQPFIRPETIDLLIEQYRLAKPRTLIPTYQGRRGNPVLLDRSIFAEAMALEGDVGCRALFQHPRQAIVNLEVKDEGILLDIDNREDYARLFRE